MGPKKEYTAEFKTEAVKMVLEQHMTRSSVAKRLGVNYHTIREWVQLAQSASPVSLVSKELPLEEQVRQLQKENARLRMEREILKKATAFFAKEHP